MLRATHEYLELIATALTKEVGAGIKVVSSEENAWMTDVETRTIYYPRASFVNYPFYIIRGLIIHEVGHLLFSEHDPKQSDRDTVKKYGAKTMTSVYNILEDIRIERLLGSKFGRFASDSLASTNYHLIDGTMIDNKFNLTKFPKLYEFLYTFYLDMESSYNVDFASRMGDKVVTNGSIYVWAAGRRQITWRPDVIMKYSDNLLQLTSVYKTAKEAKSVIEVKNIIDKDLVPIIKEYLEEEKKKQDEQKAKADGKPSELGSLMPTSFHQLMSDPSKIIARNDIPDGSDTGTLPSEKEAKSLLRPWINTLSNRLRDILKERSASRVTGNYKRGKLLSKNTYKATLDEERIFSRKINPNEPKHNVFLGLDRSGSMSLDRIYWAYMGGILLQEVSKRLKFPTFIYQYGTNPQFLEEGVKQYRGGGSDNYEWRLFELMTKNIKERGLQGDDNLIFIITDGGTDRNKDFVKAEEEIKKVGGTLYGIGIGNGRVEEMIRKVYHNGIYSPTLEGLPLAIINLMRKIIKR